jgi:hypothetical protein
MALATLTDFEHPMLDLEREWWRTPGAKEAAISDRFGMSAVRYYQLLVRLIASEEALAYDPLVVNRLRRIATQPRPGRGSSTHG